MAAAPRVVSLLPSATEILFALGQGQNLVGRSHECDFPAEAESATVCSRPRLDPAGNSPDIDRDVKALLEQGLSVFEVDAEALAAAQPDVILTQTQCEVCAVTPGDIESALVEWTGQRPQLVSLQPDTLNDVWNDISSVASALNVQTKGEAVIADAKARIAAIKTLSTSQSFRPTVASIEWIDPLMAAGNWVPELIEAAGGENVFGQAGEHSPWLEWDALISANPDIIVVMPCGFDLEKTLAESRQLKTNAAWNGLKAVRNGQVFAVDGHQYFNRPGPRLVESVDILAEIIAGFGSGHSMEKTSTGSDLPRTSRDPMGRSRYEPIN